MKTLAIALLLIAPVAADSIEWMDLDAALDAARQSDRPVLVYVSAPWCGPCQRLESETFADPAVQAVLAEYIPAGLRFDDDDRTVRVGAYRLTEAQWAERLGATATPTLVLLASDGSVAGRYQGFVPPEGLLPILEAVRP